MPIIEERRIYQSSKSSLAITLPRGWLRYFKLKAGDKVEIETGDGDELIIRPCEEDEDWKELSRNPEFISAMGKIVEGLEKSSIDWDKVKKVSLEELFPIKHSSKKTR